jgi:hypothetical protein
MPGLCGNGEIDPMEDCGEDVLPECSVGLLCVNCACRELGDCQDNGGGIDLYDIIEKVDIVLGRETPTASQLVLCDDDCDTDIDLFDVLNEIDAVLGVIETPLLCPE